MLAEGPKRIPLLQEYEKGTRHTILVRGIQIPCGQTWLWCFVRLLCRATDAVKALGKESRTRAIQRRTFIMTV